MEKTNTAYETILHVASEIFYKKGLAGARMQEIADLAGINKAMLHYYFKTKEQLFNQVFEKAFFSFSSRIAEVLNSEEPLKIKISNYVDHTIDALKLNRGILIFVIYELNVNPERITELFAGKGNVDFSIFKKQVKAESKNEVNADMLFTDMVALCIYPFIAQPILKKMMNKDEIAYRDFLEERKSWIKSTLISRL